VDGHFFEPNFDDPIFLLWHRFDAKQCVSEFKERLNVWRKRVNPVNKILGISDNCAPETGDPDIFIVDPDA